MSLVAYSDDSEDEEILNENILANSSSVGNSSAEMEKSDTDSTVPCVNLSSDSNSSVEIIAAESSTVKKHDPVLKESSSGLESLADMSGTDGDERSSRSTDSEVTCVDSDSESSCEIIADKSSLMEKLDSVPKESSTGLQNDSMRGKDGENRSRLFCSLPPPVTFSPEIDLERQKVEDSPKCYKRKPVKITIPSLDSVIEEKEEQSVKKRKTMQKGSQLFAILPPPKAVPIKEVNRPLVPNVLTKKTATTSVGVKRQLKGKHQKPSVNKHELQEENSDSGDESGAEGTDAKCKDFFSLSGLDVDVKDDKKLDETIDPRLSSGSSHGSDLSLVSTESSSSCGSYHPPSSWTTFLPHENDEKSSSGESCTRTVTASDVSSSSSEQPVTGGSLSLDEEAFKRLGGPKYKQQMQAMEIIDISEDTIMPDSNEWLTKQLTVETNNKIHGHSHRKNDGPTTQQRRKHQITYLAFQAKEKELELKNQWSQNRMSRKQTQSKYGF